MVANSSDSLIPAAQAERRPAIWPWLVMPLVTLALFYGLDRLKQSQDQSFPEGTSQTASSAAAQSSTP